MERVTVHALVVIVTNPFEGLHVRSARVWFGVADGRVVRIDTSLRGRVRYEDVYRYLSNRLGTSNLVHAADYRSWWGNRYCRVGPGWDKGCGVTVTIEGATLGHPISLQVSEGSEAARPPNNRLKLTLRGR